MIKKRIIVPGNVRYISDWKGFRFFQYPHILDKKLPGCGFTEWCITNEFDTVTCSPRRVLLDNKEEQHIGEVFYFRSDLDKCLNVDKDLLNILKMSKEEVNVSYKKQLVVDMEDRLRQYIERRRLVNKPIKIIVTYDSFRLLKEVLIKMGLLQNFYVVVDEFQSIFTDSRFKSDTELEFLNHLRDIQKLCFVSATPMIDTYLEMLDEFKDLPYYELDWATENPTRLLRPDLKVRVIRSVVEKAVEIINSYKTGDFETALSLDENNNVIPVISIEAVLYVNSVKNIVSIIKKAGLKPDEVNVLCANTVENQNKLNKIAGKNKYIIGRVPLRGEPHKMFTLCTRTVYLGADFYSTNARSFVLSDANIETLAVDITLDLPQILGRQRLKENPWKNRAELFVKCLTKSNIVTEDDFKKYINKKIKSTKNLLSAYDTSANNEVKHSLAEKYQKGAKSENYRDDYVAVNTHGGKDLLPTFNDLVFISERRAFDIQQIDYADRFSVFNKLSDTGHISSGIIEFIKTFNTLPTFFDKMRSICESSFNEDERLMILEQVPLLFKNLYLEVGPERLKANSYNITEIKQEINSKKINSTIDIKSEVFKLFEVGKRYILTSIKSTLKDLYSQLGYRATAKATDLENYFNLKKCQIIDKTAGKKFTAYEILSKKD